jgi:SAM-dependent methyltransferase
MIQKLKIKDFYGIYSTGARLFQEDKKFFSEKNIKINNKIILNNINKMGLNQLSLKNKTIMNVGSGREALGFLQFNCKKIYHYDISKANILNFKKIIKSKKLSDKIISKQLDLSRDILPNFFFDLVYLHGIIQHVDHVGKAIGNIANSLKKDGFLWFYFYRLGSIINFLIIIQRFLVKNINIDDFYKKLKKQKSSLDFEDGIMDDCYVPNIQFFYPRDYFKFFKKINFECFGNSFLVHNKKKYDFNRFHSSTVLFLKKKSDKKLSIKFKNFLKPNQKENINILDKNTYNEKIIKEILKKLCKGNNNDFDENFKKIMIIQKLKNNIKKEYSKNHFLNEAYILSSLEKVKKILQ